MPGKKEYQIGLVVPLKEEFQYVADIAAIIGHHVYDGTYFYELDFNGTSTIACIVGEMGPLPASHATNRLLSFANVKLVVLLGLAGSLDKDIALGDVVVADEVNEFLAKSKAVEAGDGYALKFSGRHYRMGYSLRETVNHFDVSAGDCIGKWHRLAKIDFEALESGVNRSLCNSPPLLHVGSIASGDVVGAAKAFTEQLLEIDRKFLALDMEAAGVFKAAIDRLNSVPILVVRGISDFADERKKQLDEQGKGVWRRLSVRNAASLLAALLAWDAFRQCVGMTNDSKVDQKNIEPAQIVEGLRDRTGGPWLVGVLFELHSQAPACSDKSEVQVKDIITARVDNEQLDGLMNCVEQIKSRMNAGSITADSITEQLAQAIDLFRATLESAEIELLTQFDEVILTILAPDNDDELSELEGTLSEIESMIDDERLDEAEQMLAVLDSRQSGVRQLVADLYYGRHQYEDVVRLLSSCDAETLGRRELEHFITSCYELSQYEIAIRLLQIHIREFVDAAGKLFQRNIVSRYPDAKRDLEDKG